MPGSAHAQTATRTYDLPAQPLAAALDVRTAWNPDDEYVWPMTVREADGRQVLSGGWIARMTSPLVRLGENFGNMYYGYLWYRPDRNRAIYAAIGDGGNVIYVHAEKGISVGVTGTFRPRIYDRVDFIERNVLPLIEG